MVLIVLIVLMVSIVAIVLMVAPGQFPGNPDAATLYPKDGQYVSCGTPQNARPAFLAGQEDEVQGSY